MPNWAFSEVEVTGSKAGVISFIERFIDSQESVTPGKRFFARSFLEEDRDKLIQDVKDSHAEGSDEAPVTVNFDVSFAWSAYSCIISGYPEHDPDELITLSEACLEDRVSVLIWTEEPNMCFEEELSCDADGEVTYLSRDLLSVRCRSCGATWSVASWADLPELECGECGSSDLAYETTSEQEE